MTIFNRLTERARNIIILAGKIAYENQNKRIGTGHLLLGLLKDNGGVAIAVLRRLDIDIDQIKAETESLLPASSNTLMLGDIPFSLGSKRVLEQAVEETRTFGHSYVGSVHLLLALFHVTGGVAERVINDLNITYDDARRITESLLKKSAVSREIELGDDESSTDGAILPPEIRNLKTKLNKLTERINQQIEQEMFESVLEMREKEDNLRAELKRVIEKWGSEHGSNPAEQE